MKRRTLDLLFSVGGLALAVLLLVFGLVMKNNADFAKSYVKDQLTQQQITFTPAAGLADVEKKSDCLVANAGKQLTTGKQAECYANDYIALHLREAMEGGGFKDGTYATIGTPQRALAAEVKAATEANDPKLPDLQTKLTAINGLRDTAFKGETLRGLLLTSYGFSVFGEKAAQAYLVAVLAGLVLLVASIAGFVHWAKTSKDAVVV
jgi:hypothetical protein